MTFYFYDLETSGINARAQRIMQFAGQRTDENFNPIGEPDNWLVKLSEEVLPDPDAVLITGITPQKTQQEGYSEAEFLKLFYESVCQPDTIITGFNSIRFDDEFMRNTLWRNFYDPYEWQWGNGRSRWDLLDVVRMVRALRPDGIEWPVDEAGEPTNRLELLTAANNLSHENAHDALSDVYATIAVAKLLKEKQPKMFTYLLQARTKQAVSELVDLNNSKPFVYCSGRYSNKWQKTTAVIPLAAGAHGAVLVYDLRVDPSLFEGLAENKLAEKLFTRDAESELLPVKVLKPNVCPAVAPLGVLDEASQKRLNLPIDTIEQNLKKLTQSSDFARRVQAAYEKHSEQRKASFISPADPEFQLYDGFAGDKDKDEMRVIRALEANQIKDHSPNLIDKRLATIFLRYKARNFSQSLSDQERSEWERYRAKRILEGLPGQLSWQQFAERINELNEIHEADSQASYLLEELKLWAENIMPVTDEG